MEVLYAFMHHTDAIVDEAASDATDHTSRQTAQSVAIWRQAVMDCLLSADASCDSNVRNLLSDSIPHDPAGIDSTGRQILQGMRVIVRQYGIPLQYLLEVIDGVAMDTKNVRFDTFLGLADYCDKVATAVGIASMYIWGFHNDKPEVYQVAQACGRAFQLTNILRDIREDFGNNRIYLPLDEFETFDISVPDDLKAMIVQGHSDNRFDRFMQFQLDRVASLYQEAKRLTEFISPDSRRLFLMMLDVYGGLYRKIASRPDVVLRHRVRLGDLHKFAILLRRLLLP